MKSADARNATSAAVIGCNKGGKCSISATNWNKARVGIANVPTGECPKCCISTADVMVKKVDEPRQNGSEISTSGTSIASMRRQKPQIARVMEGSVRISNHI